MKSAAVYMSSNKMILHPASATTTGAGLATEPFIKLDLPVSSNSFLQSMLDVLAAVKTGVPHPTDWKAQAENYHRNMGLNSKKLHKDFTYCLIEMDDSFFYFTPSNNLGANKGYTYLPAQKIKVEIFSSADDIYDALLRAMKISKESIED